MKTSDRSTKVAPLFKVWFSRVNAAARLETSIPELGPEELSQLAESRHFRMPLGPYSAGSGEPGSRVGDTGWPHAASGSEGHKRSQASRASEQPTGTTWQRLEGNRHAAPPLLSEGERDTLVSGKKNQNTVSPFASLGTWIPLLIPLFLMVLIPASSKQECSWQGKIGDFQLVIHCPGCS